MGQGDAKCRHKLQHVIAWSFYGQVYGQGQGFECSRVI